MSSVWRSQRANVLTKPRNPLVPFPFLCGRCGSPRASTLSPAPPLCTADASDLGIQLAEKLENAGRKGGAIAAAMAAAAA